MTDIKELLSVSHTLRYVVGITYDGTSIIRDTLTNMDIYTIKSNGSYICKWVYCKDNEYLQYKKKGLFKRTRYFDCKNHSIVKKI